MLPLPQFRTEFGPRVKAPEGREPPLMLNTPVTILVPSSVAALKLALVMVPPWKVGSREMVPPSTVRLGIPLLTSFSDPPVISQKPAPAKVGMAPYVNAPPERSMTALAAAL